MLKASITPLWTLCVTITVRSYNPSKLGCATLTLHGFGHFCACALAGATRLCACKHARSSRFSQQSRLPWLGLAQFCGRKPISKGALKKLFHPFFTHIFKIDASQWRKLNVNAPGTFLPFDILCLHLAIVAHVTATPETRV